MSEMGQITRFFCIYGLGGPVSVKYSGLVIQNVQTQKITCWWIFMTISGHFRNGTNYKLQFFFFVCIQSTGPVSGLTDQYPINIPDL